MDPQSSLREALRFARRDLRPDAERVPGVVLALYRVAADIRPYEVAGVLNVSRQYVGALEVKGATIEVAGRFRAAVDTVAAERQSS